MIAERLYCDKDDPNILHNEVTTIDHALTRPWTVTRSYHRDTSRAATAVDRDLLHRGQSSRVPQRAQLHRSGDGNLMPARKDEPPPDLRNFATRK